MADSSIILSQIRDEAKRKNVRWTEQRQCIVRIFVEAGGHISVEQLHGMVRQEDASVSPATIYRTLNLLVDIGVAVKRSFEDDLAHFELLVGRKHHDHLIDVDTGTVYEFTNDEIEELQKLVAARLGYELTDHRLVLYGKRLSESDCAEN